jgi:hypothetical protein
MQMTIRFIGASVTALALIAGFALGRATGPQVASAQGAPAIPHFMCYQTTLATNASAAAKVSDQFGSTARKFFRADMFCAPAKKAPIDFHPRAVPANANHLTCYHTEGATLAQSRKIMNQLESTAFKGLTPRYFCLPTFKQEMPGAAG